jgi:hypothetical protein
MDSEVKKSFRINTRIWWNITWKTLVFSLPFSYVLGILGSQAVVSFFNGKEGDIEVWRTFFTYIGAIPVSIMVIGHSINTNYGKYRLSLIKVGNDLQGGSIDESKNVT